MRGAVSVSPSRAVSVSSESPLAPPPPLPAPRPCCWPLLRLVLVDWWGVRGLLEAHSSWPSLAGETVYRSLIFLQRGSYNRSLYLFIVFGCMIMNLIIVNLHPKCIFIECKVKALYYDLLDD